MRRDITVNFKDIQEYRKKLGRDLLHLALSAMTISPQTILEIGPGRNPVIFDETNPWLNKTKMTFVEPDISSALLLKTNVQNSIIHNETFEKKSSEFKNQQFDVIISHFSLHWFSNLNFTVDEIVRIMKRHGIFALTITDQARSFWGKINAKFIERFPNCSLYKIGYSHSLSAPQWEKLLSNAGLSLVTAVDVTGIASEFDSATHALQQFKAACGIHYLDIPKNQPIELYENWILDYLRQKNTNPPGIQMTASAFQSVWLKIN